MIEALVGILIILIALKVLFWVFVILFSPIILVGGILISILLFGALVFGGFFLLLFKVLILPFLILLLLPFCIIGS